jgi:glutaredoxin
MDIEFIKPKITGYTIYSKSGCPNCNKVKKILNIENSSITVIDCDEYLIEKKDEFLKFIEEISEKPINIFPIVFFDRKLVGGYEETVYHFNRLNAFLDDIFV